MPLNYKLRKYRKFNNLFLPVLESNSAVQPGFRKISKSVLEKFRNQRHHTYNIKRRRMVKENRKFVRNRRGTSKSADRMSWLDITVSALTSNYSIMSTEATPDGLKRWFQKWNVAPLLGMTTDMLCCKNSPPTATAIILLRSQF